MEKEKKLLKNTAIFGIGAFCSKMLQFLLIPFYTRVLTDSQYGTIDILQNLGTLLIPIISLTIAEAVFRFAMEKNSNKEEILSTAFFSVTFNILIISILSVIIYNLTRYEYTLLLVVYISASIIRTIFSQYIRAIGKVKFFTLDNIINIFTTILFIIIFLIKFDMGVTGYLLGYIIGNIISIFTLFFIGRLYKVIKFKKISKKLFVKMLKFSIPLIPNSICWWIINFSDRIMITYFSGSGENGIYSVAHKLPTIITVLVDVFFQAWQISANSEIENKDINVYYSKTFECLFTLVFITCSFFMLIAKLVTKVALGIDFQMAWYYMPMLLVSTAFFSMAQFLGSIYTAKKKTKMAFVTNLSSAIINIILNFVLLYFMGTIGAAVATAISYMFLWMYRAIDTKKLVNISYNFKNIFFSVLLLLIECVLITIQIKYAYIYSIAIFILLIFMHYKTIYYLIVKIKEVFKGVLLKFRRTND